MCETETSIIIEKYRNDFNLIERYTDKTISEVLTDYTVPELMRLNAFLIFMQYPI
jgi:hypothetical protein